MADREKVIKGLEHCVDHHLCLGCRYYNPNNTRCQKDLMRDALALLEEQEPKSPCSDCQEFVCDGCKYAKGREVW